MLRWGVVGVGAFLEGTIAPAILEDPNSEMTAVTSRDPEKAESFASRWDLAHSVTDYQRMLQIPEVDAIYISTPNALHPEQAIAAARAGKHVFCEKPLANTAADAAKVVAECSEAGVRLGVNFHNRYVDWVRDVTAIVAEGAIGDVMAVEVDVGSGPRHYENWRADPEMAGLGSVHNVGVHALDFLRVILAAEPVEVAAMFDGGADGETVEMLAMILLRFDDGVMAYCNCNERLVGPSNAIKIYGSSGTVTGTGFTRARLGGELRVRRGDTESLTRYPAVAAHQRCLAAFTLAVLNDVDPVPSGVDGLRSAQVCEAIARSASERRFVPVDYGTG